MSTLISVIIPVYNSENTIKKCLESILNQKGFNNFEVIVINDGSTDNTEKIINEFILLNKKLLINYYYKKNEGVSIARNFGLKKAKGDFIAFLDSDDAWIETKIATQLNIFTNNPAIDFLGTNKDGDTIKRFMWYKIGVLQKISPKFLLFKNFFMTSSVLFKSKIIKEIGYFNEEMNYAEDLEYFLRINAKFNCYLYNKNTVNSITGKFSFGDSGLSANLWKMEKGELKSIKKGYELKIINGIEYVVISVFSFLKYLRRVFITFLRH